MTQQFQSWVYTQKKKKDTCMPALFTVAKMWKQLKCLLMDEWIGKTWYLLTLECYAVLKKKDILTHSTTWVALEGIMLSEISQSRKDRYCVMPLT